MQKVQRLQNLKKKSVCVGGMLLSEGFQALASLTWGWFKLEVKVWARCLFSMNQSISLHPNDHTTELQEAEDHEAAVEGGLRALPGQGSRELGAES